MSAPPLRLLTAPPPQLFFTGKGGVGKTSLACAIGLVERGLQVHLSTTDPAAHLVMTLAGDALPGLLVDRIDPKVETERYVERIMTTRGRDLDEQGAALLREDLRSPCTEEVAVFHAFSRIVAEARSASSSCPGRQARRSGCPRYGAWLPDSMQSVPATHRKAAPGR
jgi:hypothetical protein